MRLKRAVRMFFVVAALAVPAACGIDLLATGDGASVADGSATDGRASLDGASGDALDEGTQYLIPPTTDPLQDAGLDVNNANCLASCPAGAASCDAGWCVFDCAADNSCASRVACPPGIPCDVRCGGKNACAQGIDCTAGSACRIACTGESSCDMQPIACSGLGCQLDCIGTRTCHAGVDCDASTCAINCIGSDACHDGQTRCTGESCTIRCGTANKKEMMPPCQHNVICETTKLCDIGCVGDGTCPNDPVMATSRGTAVVQCTGDNTCTNGALLAGGEAGILCTGNGSCGDRTYCDAGSCTAACQDHGLTFCCDAPPGKCVETKKNCNIDNNGCP